MSISIQNLTKAFGAASVVDNLTLEIDDGEFVVLLGPSGCGKTTTLRMIAGLEQPTAGEIFVDGQRVNHLPPQKRDIAMVFQSYALYPHMNVADNIAYPLRVRKIDRETIRQQVRDTADLLEIGPLLTRRPRELSGGERQRVALARAIVRHPRAFLMDEPLSNLDAKLRLQTRAELKHLQQQLGTTTVYVTHDQAEAMTLGHRVALMNKGVLQQFAAPLEIYHHPANRFVAEFVGNPGMNFIEGELAGGEFRAGSLNLRLRDDCLPVDGPRELTLGIRSEHIRVTAVSDDGGIPARVYVTELMGSEVFVVLELNNVRLVARAPGHFRADTGATVWLDFDLTQVHFFEPDSGVALKQINAPSLKRLANSPP